MAFPRNLGQTTLCKLSEIINDRKFRKNDESDKEQHIKVIGPAEKQEIISQEPGQGFSALQYYRCQGVLSYYLTFVHRVNRKSEISKTIAIKPLISKTLLELLLC